MDLTDTLKAYVHSKIGALEKIIGNSEDINIFIELVGNQIITTKATICIWRKLGLDIHKEKIIM
ncbi:MAG: HPF/RaiA family ribosome-associated protein [Candidatus Paceibacterota bacterium]